MPDDKNASYMDDEYVQVKCAENEVIRGENYNRKNLFFKLLLPALCGCTIKLSFGLMLGWPSPSFPTLLSEDSPVPITIDQSAIIAGFLMWGNAAGVLPSFTKRVGAKYGMIIGKSLILIGWCVMWRVESVYELFASRFLIGFGHSFGTGQLKAYIAETCPEMIANGLHQRLEMFTNIGLVIVFTLGAAVEFRTLCLICFAISAACFLALCCVPQTALELVRRRKFEDAKKMLAKWNGDETVEFLIDEYERKIMDEKTAEQVNVSHLLRHKETRNLLIFFAALIFCTMYSGAPPSMVYTQIVFQESGVPCSQYFAILYALVYMASIQIGTSVYKTYNSNFCLCISFLCVSLSLVCQVLVLIYDLDSLWWTYTSVIVMLIFLIVHTVGINVIVSNLIVECFPESAKTAITKFYTVHFSVSALTSTKFFQVLYATYGMHVAFSTCAFVGFLGFLLTLWISVLSCCTDTIVVVDDNEIYVTERKEDILVS